MFQQHNWIGNSKLEWLCVLLLPFLCCLALFFLPVSLLQNDNLPEFAWLFLVVFVDVGHVYSTFYRTYADKQLVAKHRNLFFGLPLLLLVISVLLHSMSNMLFWRCLAYLAVYHFIRQQYGFLKIYSRKNNYPKAKCIIDTITIYGVTFLPVAYWHFASDRQFTWFIKGDFFQFGDLPFILSFILILFWLLISVYVISEIIISLKTKTVNFQKNLIVSGTALSWYVGIVYFNSDVVFTLLNILCHGIPYMALVWIHGKKSNEGISKSRLLKIIYGRFSILFFLLPLLFFAYFEEGLWDLFVWKDHADLFSFSKNSNFSVSKNVLNIIVPLLALPQLFHYVIDGYIWKLRQDKFEWTKIL